MTLADENTGVWTAKVTVPISQVQNLQSYHSNQSFLLSLQQSATKLGIAHDTSNFLTREDFVTEGYPKTVAVPNPPPPPPPLSTTVVTRFSFFEYNNET